METSSSSKENDGGGKFWFTYNHSNGTLTKLNQVWSASGAFSEVIGDILYMRGKVGHGHAEVWAYSAVNATTWMIEDIYSRSASSGSEAGEYLHTVVNDILLFDAWSGVTMTTKHLGLQPH